MKVKELKDIFIKGRPSNQIIKFDIISDRPNAFSDLKEYSDECEVVDAKCMWTFTGIVVVIRVSYTDSLENIIKGIDNKIAELQKKKVELERALYQTPSE